MRRMMKAAMAAMLVIASAAPAAAQVRTVDPNSAIDADLAPQPRRTAPVQQSAAPTPSPAYDPAVTGDTSPPSPAPDPGTATAASDTFERDDLIGAAEDVFGRGAEGLAGIIENILKDQGRPNAYIAGREASGAFFVGLRYGSGIMTHKIEGQRKVFWTGPSVGFDVGGDANKVFALVYNLYDSQELYKRFPAAEGRVYFVGGFAATYMRHGDVVLIPIRLGVGWRLGANVGYMNFTEKSKWLPF